jgi:hypothetical protein
LPQVLYAAEEQALHVPYGSSNVGWAWFGDPDPAALFDSSKGLEVTAEVPTHFACVSDTTQHIVFMAARLRVQMS